MHCSNWHFVPHVWKCLQWPWRHHAIQKKRRHSKWSVFEGTEKNRTGPLSASVSLPLTSARYLPVHSNRWLILFRLPFSKQGKIIFIFRVRHDPGLTGTIREALHHLTKAKTIGKIFVLNGCLCNKNETLLINPWLVQSNTPKNQLITILL